MDANGQRFWMLSEPADWASGPENAARYDTEFRSLRLQSRRSIQLPLAATGEAAAFLERVPDTRDAFGTRAFWDAGSRAVHATGALETAVRIFEAPAGQVVTDLATGYDGVLYLALAGRVVLVDLRQRWEPFSVEAGGFEAWRLAAHPRGGVWVLDRTNRRVARVEGLPARTRGPYAPTTFRPCTENPALPRLSILPDAAWPAAETPAAIAASPEGRLALLTWVPGNDARVRLLGDDYRFLPPITLAGSRNPFSITWTSGSEIAVMLVTRNQLNQAIVYREAPVYEVTGSGAAPPRGDIYPLRRHTGGPFLHGVTLPPHYPTPSGGAPLHHLQLPSLSTRAQAGGARPFDSGSAQTEWHRLYLEACIPAHCGVLVSLAATDTLQAPGPGDAWYPHQFGSGFGPVPDADVPRGTWVSLPSEVPFQASLVPHETEKDRAGLFTALVQRSGRRVRTLRGRYLWVRVELSGDGRATPDVFALRVYGSRFSYLNRYLPELYHESLFGPDADQPGPATPPDFLERFLDNFESILTPLEDRIANAHLLTDANSAPEEALEWLGGWIGLNFDPAYPAERRRALLKSSPELFRRRGTVRGLALALDVATGGGVSGGEIVVIEDYRLRRTFATILGADLAEEEDPLLSGIAVTGNSFVGDTLFLGDEHKKEFLALFAADLPKTATEEQAIEALFDRLANRVTVLVHQEVSPQDLGLIRRIVDLETPAHVAARVEKATNSFVVGMASLVGVDTYLAKPTPPQSVRVDLSGLGLGDRLLRPPSLDPRLEGADTGTEAPQADAGPGRIIEAGTPALLDASGSRAGAGRRITRYFWTMLR